ncbi:acetyl-CoA carboxylase biotin carboxyl carrier protein [Agathobaculum sp. NSJ-28]|uniref:Biotin carboxyl carrier protein of acetyl-CoA carboxylase n=1 Tax=Agathobaculum faecis TaxID=2763013 RepID=A0A923RW44_9FIRM|nr:acetyl-CoA carboxylase biotin carboxyl carrier protein [Agathobaculum faecis]MBC5725593.1 acetyl-CoA carboxylase biotin carboxyl carrier protein [Agathobaculum faecis]
MDIKELKDVAIELMDALKAKGLGEVEIELDDVKLKIKSAPPAPVVAAPAAPVVAAPAAAPAAASEDEAPAAAAAEDLPEGTPVKSPLVGTFYSSPSPDAPPFVLVGQKVKEGDTLFIVEAMKTMNEIKSPCDGTVVRILAQPGDMVEYNQTIVVIE